MNTKKFVVAVDDGFDKTKLACLMPGLNIQMAIPSCARAGAYGAMSVLGGTAVHPCYTTHGNQYTVGDNFHNTETARFDDYPFSDMNRAIVHHALRMAAVSHPELLDQEIHLATGLPISSFYLKGKPNKTVVDRKIASLLEPIEATDDSRMAKISKHVVFPEGLSAWIDYAMDRDLQMRPHVDEQTVGIIDVGGRTTDVAVVLPGQCIDHARTTSIEVGVQDVKAILDDLLTERFQNQHKTRVVLNPRMISEALSGHMRVFGKTENVQTETHAAVEEITQRLMREISRNLGSGSDIDAILLVGGGAHLFTGLANYLPNIIVPESPEFANARGFAKFAML